MFYFLQPVWMFAMAGIIIPVIIHLWNVQQGKILKVGSVALLTQDAVRNSSSIKLHDLLLLLLRCLLIIFLAMLLAQPQWQSTNAADKKGWVLMEKNNLQQTYTHFKPQVDSLVNAGYEFHYFDKGFETKSLQDALNETADTAYNNSAPYWATLSQLNKQLDTLTPVYLFTGNSLNRFSGNRPGVLLNLHWYTYANTVTAGYIQQAYAIGGADSFRIITANNTQTGTTNTYTDVAESQLTTGDYKLSTSSNGLQLSYKGGPPFMVDTATLRITIYADKYTTDAGYVKAAIDAVQQFSKRKIAVTIQRNAAHIPAGVSWLFWLSDENIPAGITAKNMLLYQGGTAGNIHSWLTESNSAAISSGQPVLYRSIPPGTHTGQAVWQDGFGNAVLQKQEGQTNTYRFYSRFNPSWNDLPWSNSFPQMMFDLLIPGDEALYNVQANDKRIMDEKQLQPYFVKQKKGVQHNATMITNLSPWFWLAACLVFFMERVISFKAKKGHSNAG